VSSRAAALWILLFVALALVGGLDLLNGDEGTRSRGPGLSSLASSGTVVRVIDGDTVHVRIRGTSRTVRYIGVDTPESVKPSQPVECFAKRASDFNRRLVSGREVRLRFGPERRDRYGRLLAYVYLPGRKRSVSAELIARGYGRVLTIEPNSAHRIPYERLERRARQAGRGLWGRCPL
jgi:micrococcal nuclease